MESAPARPGFLHARTDMRSFAFAALVLASPSALADVACIDPPLESLYRTSTVVVAATVEGVSHTRVGTASRETILWRVDEQWKGPHYKGSTFTTRNGATGEETVARGQSFLLLLSGREPYDWTDSCAQGRRRLQESLRDVEQLYRVFRQEREART